MKHLLLLVLVAGYTSLFSQQIIPDGRYTCANPAWQVADSLVFVFYAGNYEWYINGNKSSSGTFSFIDGPAGNDTVALVESPSAACVNNGGHNPVKFNYQYSSVPSPFFNLLETDNSIANCSVHSPHFPGTYNLQTLYSGIETIKDNSRITLLPASDGIKLLIANYTGSVICEIYSLDGRLIQKEKKQFISGLFFQTPALQIMQTLLTKITLEDGTFKSARFVK